MGTPANTTTGSRRSLDDAITRDRLQDAIDAAYNNELRSMLNDGIIGSHDYGRYTRATVSIKLRTWDNK